ncbi:ABC transporter ATP-binding protein [Patescibacteria group bacterium]|nr:ABC transporter ATP-binding protein [Patescibacteria group bacterium]
MKNNHAVIVDNVSKKYRLGELTYRTLRDDVVGFLRRKQKEERSFWALSDVSFQLKQGESIGIIGTNGAGKSTMLKILAGVTRPTSGSVEKRGKVGALIELSAGFHPELTGRENIYLYGSIIGLGKAYIKKRFDEIVDFSGLSQFIDTPIKKYSSGMYTRLGFSVTAHLDPDILLIDEVLSVGDFTFQGKCINKMLEYRKNGVSIIFVSHNLESVKKLCPKVILLQKGSVHKIGDAESVIEEYYRVNAINMKGECRGDELIDLLEARLYSEGNSDQFTFNSGENAVFKMRIRAKKQIKDVSFGLFLRNSDGMIIFDVSSNYNKVEHQLEEGQTIEIMFCLRLNLLKGLYHLGINIFGAEGNKAPEFIEYIDNLSTFMVKGNVPAKGIVNLEPKMMFKIESK